jgi:predicted GNAT family N-acyltransferase
MVWGMVGKIHHKKGYGKQLFEFRVKAIKERFPDHKIILDTSQHTYGFFAKLGYKVTKITPNAYGEGLDKYDME